MNEAKKTPVSSEIPIALCSIIGGATGGIGHHVYSKTYNSNEVQGTYVADGLSGIIASFIGIVFISWKFKQDFTLRQIAAIGMALGLVFHAVFGGIKNVAKMQTQIYQLQDAVATEQQYSVENISAIALESKDPKIKEKAIAAVADIAERSDEPEKPIEAIKNLALESRDSVKIGAVEKLSTIVDKTDNQEIVSSAVAAINETSSSINNEQIIIQTLGELQQLAFDAQTEEKRKEIIFKMAEYKGQYSDQVDLWLGAKLNYLHDAGKNNYLIYNPKLKMLERVQ